MKDCWYIDTSLITQTAYMYATKDKVGSFNESIGNCFGSMEEAKQMVEKLRAWKRLKDRGFRFTFVPGVGALDTEPGKFQIDITADMPEKWFCCDAVAEDLNLLFGGEDE